MLMERIRELRLAHPFRPFYLILNDKRRFLIDEAWFLGIAPDLSHLMVIDQGVRSVHLMPGDVVDVVYPIAKAS